MLTFSDSGRHLARASLGQNERRTALQYNLRLLRLMAWPEEGHLPVVAQRHHRNRSTRSPGAGPYAVAIPDRCSYSLTMTCSGGRLEQVRLVIEPDHRPAHAAGSRADAQVRGDARVGKVSPAVNCMHPATSASVSQALVGLERRADEGRRPGSERSVDSACGLTHLQGRRPSFKCRSGAGGQRGSIARPPATTCAPTRMSNLRTMVTSIAGQRRGPRTRPLDCNAL